MAGPRMIGIRDVIDPYEGLQKAVSNAGDIYREYERSSREADVHNAKMQEVERINHQRDFLKNYDPQLGVQGKGLSDDAKIAAQAEEERIVQHFAAAAARGEEVPSPEELRKRISATYGKLATQESAQQAIVQDLVAQGFGAADAAAHAQALTGGLVSRASLQEQETARVAAEQAFNKEVREAGDKALQRQHEGITANAKVLDVENKARFGYYTNGSRTTSGSKPFSETYQDADAFATALENKISRWPIKIDSNAALDVIHKGLESYNQKRLVAGLPTLPRSAAYNYAYESIGSKWLIDRDINAQTPGEFEVSLEERFDGDAGAFRGGQYGGGGRWGAGGAGGSVMTQLDPNSANMLRNVVLVQPRSMTEIERARVKDAFKDYIPRPQAAAESGNTATATPAGGSTTTTAPQQETGGTQDKKSGAELAAETEEAIRKRDAKLAAQEEIRRKAEEARAAREEAAKAAADRAFLTDPSLTATERLTRLRDNITTSNEMRREEANNLYQERNQVLAAIEKNSRELDSWEERPYSRESTLGQVERRQLELDLSQQLDRLNREISEVENRGVEYVDPNRPIEELLPRGIPDLVKETGVRPRAAEISRGLLEEYESTAAPSRHGRKRSKLFQDRVDQAAQYIAETDPALAEEVRKAAVFGREYIDNRLRLVEDARNERLRLNSAREGLERELSGITIPEARYGIQQRIDNIRKQLEYLR